MDRGKKQQREYDADNFLSTLLYVRQKFGVSVFQNSGKLRSIFADLAPALGRDSKILCRLSQAGYLNNIETQDVETLCAKVLYWLKEEEFMQEERADYYTEAVRILCTWTPGQPLPTLTTAPRPVPKPPKPAPPKATISTYSYPTTYQNPSASGTVNEFQCRIMDELGIHARPAGQLAKEAKSLGETTVYVIKGGKTVKASLKDPLMKTLGPVDMNVIKGWDVDRKDIGYDAKAVAWGAQYGIITPETVDGKPSFRPDAMCTKGEFSGIMSKYAQKRATLKAEKEAQAAQKAQEK